MGSTVIFIVLIYIIAAGVSLVVSFYLIKWAVLAALRQHHREINSATRVSVLDEEPVTKAGLDAAKDSEMRQRARAQRGFRVD